MEYYGSPNPRQAIWQHLGYYLDPMCAEAPESPFRQAHVQMHKQMKAELASKRLTGILFFLSYIIYYS